MPPLFLFICSPAPAYGAGFRRLARDARARREPGVLHLRQQLGDGAVAGWAVVRQDGRPVVLREAAGAHVHMFYVCVNHRWSFGKPQVRNECLLN